MNKNIITISGKPGCGKSTIAKILSKKLNYELISSGDKFREIAKEKGINITDFTANYLPNHPEIDLEIDQYFIDYAKDNNNLIIPTRVVAYLLDLNKIEHFKVYLYADFDVRLERISYREKDVDIVDLKKELELREKSECDNFIRLYNIDINDLTMYNLVIYTHFIPSKPGFIEIRFNNKTEYIESNNTLPETISGIIIDKYKELITNI